MGANGMDYIDYPYPDKPVDIYDKLAGLPGFSLLQSSDVKRGRFDIVCAFPSAEYPFFLGDVLSVYLGILEQALYHEPLDAKVQTPFYSGLIGYFCYEFAYLMQGLPMSLAMKAYYAKKPLAVFKRYDWALVCDHTFKTMRLYKPKKAHYDKSAFARFIGALESATMWRKGDVALDSWDTSQHALSYEQGFSAVQEALRAGRSYQVNLTMRAKAQFSGQPWALYRALLTKNPVPFAAFLSGESNVLSFSPERYLQIRQGALLASPIKGTAPRSMCPAEDQKHAEQLLKSLKNRAENTMIVDMWRNDLARIAKVGTVFVSRLLALESYQTVHHLVTDIKAEACTPKALLENFLACYPAPSITGAPKYESMRIIAENENIPRGVYCGSIAYFSDNGCAEGSVAIRTITLNEATAEIGTGAGIVFDSDFASEFAECVQKIASFWI